MVTVKSKQSFKDGIASGEDEIRVENPELAKWIVLIHGIKQPAWAVSIVLVGAGIYSTLAAPATGGSTVPIAAAADALALGILGASAGSAAAGAASISAMLGIGITLGGVTGLITLRKKYKITEKGSGFVVLKKK